MRAATAILMSGALCASLPTVLSHAVLHAMVEQNTAAMNACATAPPGEWLTYVPQSSR